MNKYFVLHKVAKLKKKLKPKSLFIKLKNPDKKWEKTVITHVNKDKEQNLEY